MLDGLFSKCRERGLFSSCGTWAFRCSDSPVAEHGLWAVRASAVVARGLGIVAPGLRSTVSVTAARGLSGSAARGIFPDQRMSSCLPPWQADFLPLSHQEALSSSYCWSALPFLYFLWSLRILRTQVLSIQLFLETSSPYSKVMLNYIYLKPK